MILSYRTELKGGRGGSGPTDAFDAQPKEQRTRPTKDKFASKIAGLDSSS